MFVNLVALRNILVIREKIRPGIRFTIYKK